MGNQEYLWIILVNNSAFFGIYLKVFISQYIKLENDLKVIYYYYKITLILALLSGLMIFVESFFFNQYLAY